MEKSTKVWEETVGLSSPTETLPSYEAGRFEDATLPTAYQSPVPALLLHPAKLLTVHARGSGIWHCATGEMAISIYSGTDISTAPLYVSTRAERMSGSAVLSHKTEGDIISTKYRFGFGKNRQPKIRYIQNRASYGSDVKGILDDDEGPVALQASTNCWTNTTTMTSEINPDQILMWKYVKTQTPTEGKLRVLALYAESVSSSSHQKESGEPLAVLVRSASTRTPGTKRYDAGNGGQLLLSSTAAAFVDEGLIVASCLMCLKKEIDRQSAAQGAAVSAAVS